MEQGVKSEKREFDSYNVQMDASDHGPRTRERGYCGEQ
jgi:hypothetical protein